MSLEKYRLDRIVMQSQDGSVYNAVRAMESNHIGLVVVADHGRVTGVLTDRDVALRVVSFQLDPTQTALRDVMTEQPATLPIEASEQQALELMRDRHVRRIPLLENDTVVGLVTVDDLLLSQTADLELLREVVRAQLAEPAAFKAKGEL
ncbi:MAG: CBS domain-containing protein, partial [Deltaproteobacteria bacterium]